MKSMTLRSFALMALSVVCLLTVEMTPRPAAAAGGATRLAVLDVRGGGIDKLAAKLAELDNVDIKRQTWFLKQVKNRGFRPKGIMKRHEDIKWLMDGAEIDYIIYLAPADETTYTVRVVGPKSGTVVHEFSVDRTPDGLSDAGARGVKQQFGDYLHKQRNPVDPEAERRRRQKEKARKARLQQARDPNEVRKKATKQNSAAQEAFSKDWFRVTLRAGALSRDLHVAGSEQAVLSYPSAYYFGFGLDAEAFPLGMSNPDLASVGFYADYTQGFDSVNVLGNGGEELAVSIGHLELAGGVMYQLGDALRVKTTDRAHVNLTVGLRYSSFSVTENPALPSVSHTSVVLGTRVSSRAFSDIIRLRAGIQMEPFGFYGAGASLFGQSSHTYGFGGDLGILFDATDSLGFVLGYEMRLQRTSFSGQGEADFVDANAFELVQGLTGGLSYQY